MKDLAIPAVTGTRRVFDGRLIGVRVDALKDDRGRTYEREVVEYGVAVVLVPVDAEGNILLVRQYRHAVRRWLLELPAGGVDPHDASNEAAALRELREETGHRGTLRRIGAMFLAPGYSEEYQEIFLATDLVEDPLDADEDEDLRLERIPAADAFRLVDDGVICDAKSIAALLMYQRAARHA